MLIDRQKTVDKVLKSSFPIKLLGALVELDQAVRALEDWSAEADDNDMENVPTELLSNLCQLGCVASSEFRDAWAVYSDEENNENNEDDKDDDETILGDPDGDDNGDG